MWGSVLGVLTAPAVDAAAPQPRRMSRQLRSTLLSSALGGCAAVGWCWEQDRHTCGYPNIKKPGQKNPG